MYRYPNPPNYPPAARLAWEELRTLYERAAEKEHGSAWCEVPGVFDPWRAAVDRAHEARHTVLYDEALRSECRRARKELSV